MFLLWLTAALAQDLVVDGTTVELSGLQPYDTVRIVHGGVLQIGPDESLELQADSVFVDATSRIARISARPMP